MRYLKIHDGVAVDEINATEIEIQQLDGLYVQSDDEPLGEYYDGTSFVERIGWEKGLFDSDRLEFTNEMREWRNSELNFTDLRSTVLDDPEHQRVLDYRQALRDWTDTNDFPLTKPTFL